MKINGLTPVYFDIEATGFSSFEDDFVCAATLMKDSCTIDQGVYKSLTTANFAARKNGLLVTYNGENYRGGFDFPFLRSKCIQQGIEWQLSGVKHLDLLPLVRKYLNTTGYEPPSKSNLYADDMKRLAEANGIEYSNKSQCYEELEQLDNVDWLDYEMQPNEDNSLQSVYQKLFDPEQEEEYISGERIPELYFLIKYKEKTKHNGLVLHDIESEIDELWQQIKEHNRRDVERLKKVAEKVIPVLPNWEIKRNINKL